MEENTTNSTSQGGTPPTPTQDFGMNPMMGGQQNLPNATGVLVLGILSIVGCWCYGIVGLICGIIALVMAGKAKAMYQASPEVYSTSSYKNMNAGRVCAIIGSCLSGIYFLILIIYIVFFGAVMGSVMSGIPWGQL